MHYAQMHLRCKYESHNSHTVAFLPQHFKFKRAVIRDRQAEVIMIARQEGV